MSAVTSISREDFINGLRKEFGEVVTRQQVSEYVAKNGMAFPHWLTNDAANRVSRGNYRLPSANTNPQTTVVVENEPGSLSRKAGIVVINSDDIQSFVPEGIRGYIPFGNHKDIFSVLKSRKFCPMFISGLSGCGKTTSIIQICADEGIELFRVNITCETDEDDLLGGYRMVAGENGQQMVFQYGPVVEAMRRGAVLLLDEVDLASSKIMCLQPVLEGKGVFLKKTQQWIHPEPGFNIIATANTKGQGSDSGKFVGTNVLNEAFLDRFAFTMDQDYPDKRTEKRILNEVLAINNCNDATDKDFVDKLVTWANASRAAFKADASDEVISTRRLVYIIELYSIFGRDRARALNGVCSRFTLENRQGLLALYEKVDPTFNTSKIPNAPIVGMNIPENELQTMFQ